MLCVALLSADEVSAQKVKRVDTSGPDAKAHCYGYPAPPRAADRQD